jgi:hypothetical protein
MHSHVLQIIGGIAGVVLIGIALYERLTSNHYQW